MHYEHEVMTARRRIAGATGTLVAEGDSWFAYGDFLGGRIDIDTDIVDALQDIGYVVKSVAHHGDTMQSMAYDPKQFSKLCDCLARLEERDETPVAVLLSGGGNDISGPELGVFLNHRELSTEALSEPVVKQVIDVRLRKAYTYLIIKIQKVCQDLWNKTIPILVHGYAYAVPDGRGWWGGRGFLPGPWLWPSFRRMGRLNLDENTQTIATLIDRFNKMIGELAVSIDGVHYVDLRGDVSNELADNRYREHWDNELHLSDDAFRTVAARMHRYIADHLLPTATDSP
ncbi:MAG: hypothetical protein OXN18_09665 [Gemmatimonadota bacterium]|nr:hypothetical protein [Gemmatimonadota bacterium]